MGEKGLELGLPPTASTSARQNPLLGSEQDHITPPLALAWLGLFRLRGGKPRSFCHVIIVRFPNPLAPDI